jgi:hypothetical protein
VDPRFPLYVEGRGLHWQVVSGVEAALQRLA